MLLTDLFPNDPVFLSRVYDTTPGAGNALVPATATHARCAVLSVGGQGANWGGGGLYAFRIEPVTPGEFLDYQVGLTSTASTPGDSWIRHRSAAAGQYIAYADRGRGSGAGGASANSIGAVLVPGVNAPVGANGGAAPGDQGQKLTLGLYGAGYGTPTSGRTPAGPGGGGHLDPVNNGGTWQGFYYMEGAGYGIVAVEFYNGNPGF